MSSAASVGVAALRESTAAVHLAAERSGVIADIARKRASRPAVALFLRNLLPVYEKLEDALRARDGSPALAGLYSPDLARAPALRADVLFLAGSDWATRLPLLPATARYIARIEQCAREDASLLLAHAYVRYLGDLSGGRILRPVIAETLGIAASDLKFYEFDRIDDLAAFKANYRAAIDRALRRAPDPQAAIAEAVRAFDLNVAVSNETKACAAAAASAS